MTVQLPLEADHSYIALSLADPSSRVPEPVSQPFETATLGQHEVQEESGSRGNLAGSASCFVLWLGCQKVRARTCRHMLTRLAVQNTVPPT